MRKVKFKKYIPTTWENVVTGELKISNFNPGGSDGSKAWTVKSRGYYQEDFETEGWFHGWGFETPGYDGGISTIAIVEMYDGSVQMVEVENMMFVEPYKP